jgi:hypothetical protein
MKGKVVPVLNQLTMPLRHVGDWRYSSAILDLGIRGRWVVSFTPLPLYPRGKIPRYPLDRRLSGPQSQSGRCGEETILYCQESKSGRPARSPSLYRLSFSDSFGVSNACEKRVTPLAWFCVSVALYEEFEALSILSTKLLGLCAYLTSLIRHRIPLKLEIRSVS